MYNERKYFTFGYDKVEKTLPNEQKSYFVIVS